MALINGVKLKAVLISLLMALIRGANLKFNLNKTRGHSRSKILNDLWVPEPDTSRERHLRSCLEASNVIFAFREPRTFASQKQSRAASPQQIRVASQTAIKSRVSLALKDASL